MGPRGLNGGIPGSMHFERVHRLASKCVESRPQQALLAHARLCPKSSCTHSSLHRMHGIQQNTQTMVQGTHQRSLRTTHVASHVVWDHSLQGTYAHSVQVCWYAPLSVLKMLLAHLYTLQPRVPTNKRTPLSSAVVEAMLPPPCTCPPSQRVC